MIEQQFIPSIDTSAIIWDRQDYLRNRYAYRGLLSAFSLLITEIKNLRILISSELLAEMIAAFPASDISQQDNDLWAFVYSVYDFLSSIGSKAVAFDKSQLSGLQSHPNQIQTHFSQQAKSEILSLLSFYHTNPDVKRVYFSFRMFWDTSQILCTELNSQSEDLTAIIVDRDREFENFLDLFRLKFQHSHKHDISEQGNKSAWQSWDGQGEFNSQLSCLAAGPEAVQKLLDNRYDVKIGNQCYYSYDFTNDVYVVFRITNGTTFHAHDEYDISNIPTEVKNHFNVHKYRW